jgi:hypothetical protein
MRETTLSEKNSALLSYCHRINVAVYSEILRLLRLGIFDEDLC